MAHRQLIFINPTVLKIYAAWHKRGTLQENDSHIDSQTNLIPALQSADWTETVSDNVIMACSQSAVKRPQLSIDSDKKSVIEVSLVYFSGGLICRSATSGPSCQDVRSTLFACLDGYLTSGESRVIRS
jgi:hypothetical protein